MVTGGQTSMDIFRDVVEADIWRARRLGYARLTAEPAADKEAKPRPAARNGAVPKPRQQRRYLK